MSEIKPSPASHSYFSQRLKLHYLDWGNAGQPAMVLVHGIRDHCHTWDDLVGDFVADYHVVTPDLRGHGDSQWVQGSGYSYLDYVYDLHQLINQAELGPVVLVGHSMGGSIAALFTSIYPDLVSRLVIIEGIGLWRREGPEVELRAGVREWVDGVRGLASRQPRRYASLAEAYQRMQEANPNLSDAQALHLTVHGSNRNEDGTYSWKYDPYTYNFTQSGFTDAMLIEFWQGIACPTLILNAQNGLEHRIGHGDTAQHFGDVRLHVIQQAQHWTYHDQRQEVVQHIQAFLDA